MCRQCLQRIVSGLDTFYLRIVRPAVLYPKIWERL
jgi:hypothetical protein